MENANKNDVLANMEAKIRLALAPSSLSIENTSHHHAGHAGSPNNGISHFKIEISSVHLQGIGRVAAHQKIYRILEKEMIGHIHALEIRVAT